MFYEPKQGHPLPHNPWGAIISPRPIAWISTTGSMGDNLAPYSFFNAVAYEPPQLMFASTGTKDSLLNIRETGCFAVNIVGHAQTHQMNETSAPLPRDVSEAAQAGIEMAHCEKIAAPRVAQAPASIECELTQEIALEGADNTLIIGRAVGVHLRDDCIKEGRFDVTSFSPLARLGYHDYLKVDQLFELKRPS